MEIFDKITGFIQSIPKPVLFVVVGLVLLGIFLFWRKRSRRDSENEVIKGERMARTYARTIAANLDAEREPLIPPKDVVGAVGPNEDKNDSDLEELDDELEDIE